MTRRRRARAIRATTLAVLCGALGWLDLYLYTGSNGPVEPVLATERQQVEVAALPAEPSVSMATIEEFAEVVERPIFSPTRRAPEEAAQPAAETPAASLDFVLEGVVITPEQRLALFRPESGGDLVRVPEGAQVRGWLVVAVQPFSVVVRRGEEEEVTIDLRFEAPSPTPQAPARRARQRTAPAPQSATAKSPPRSATATPVPRSATATPVGPRRK
jgi:type II secretory pathway component PulC